MIFEYEISKLNIRILSDFEILQNGSSPLFASSFEKSDIDINMTLGNVNVDGVPVYSDDLVDVFCDKDNNFNAVYYIYMGGKKANHFLLCEHNGVLSADSEKAGRDMLYLWGMIDLPHILVQHQRIMLHCSYIISNGKAVLFCGKSGVGKSTQAQLWKDVEGAEIINGDKAVVFAEDGKLYAASLPISGTSQICSNETAEIKAIVLLAQGTENKSEILSPAEKASMLAANVILDVWRDGEMVDVVDLCSEFSQLTNVIRYECLPNESAVEYLKKVIE